MYCKKCGSKITPNNEYCSNCGNIVNNNNNIVKKSKKKKIIIIVSSIILILFIYIFLSFYLSPYDYFVSIKTNYTTNDISSMFIDKKNNIYNNNLSEFNKLINYVDKIVGKGNYLIDNISHNIENKYSIDIVLKENLNEYKKWPSSISPNKFTIEFRVDNGRYSNDYKLYNIAFDYEKEIQKELINLNSQYEYIVKYNPLLHYDGEYLKVNRFSTWNSIFRKNNNMFIENNNQPVIFVIGNNYSKLNDLESFVNNNKKIFKKYYVDGVYIIKLKQNSVINNYYEFGYNSSVVNEYKYVDLK